MFNRKGTISNTLPIICDGSYVFDCAAAYAYPCFPAQTSEKTERQKTRKADSMKKITMLLLAALLLIGIVGLKITSPS